VLENDKNSIGASIFLADNDPEFCKTVEIILRKSSYNVITADNFQAAPEIIKSCQVDLVITDLESNGGTDSELLSTMKKLYNEVEVIILTSRDSVGKAIEVVRQGAFDYIVKPFKDEELLILVKKALEYRKIRRELSILREEIAWKYSFDSLVGDSKIMNQLKGLAARAADSDIDILISGESGTGKELLARAIHYHSGRRKKKFVPIQCSSIPENLLELELFGCIDGSHINACDNRMGLFEMADKGTLFLDEISDLPLSLQAKLQRVLQESEIRPVGAPKSKKIDVRIIAATNRDLPALVLEGEFREDLFNHLNAVSIAMPPLRERADDIPALVDHFLKSENARRQNRETFISAAALEKLIAHKWPGNVRELENTIKRAITLSHQAKITADDILFITSDKSNASKADDLNIGNVETGTLEESLKQRIEKTLYANNWNLTQTAIKLGIGRTTLWRKIKKYDLRKTEGIPVK